MEQPWPSGNALDSDQRGPGFEARPPHAIGDRQEGHPVLMLVPELKSS